MVRAYFRSPSGVAGVIALFALVVLALVAPVVLSDRAAFYNPIAGNQGPSAAHLLGTDQLGRDIFLRLIVATRLTLGLAVAATAGGAAVGVLYGALAATAPNPLRSVALRAIDALIAFPALLVAIFVVAIVGPGAPGATLGVAIATSFGFARISSALSLYVGGSEYVAAARVLGVRTPRLVMRYILPNMAEALAITLTVSISSAIVAIASLSFIGLGVQPPAYDWGQMLTTGVQELYESPAAAIGPMVAIAIGALAFGFVGEAIARATNPVLWAQAAGGTAKAITGVMVNPSVLIKAATEMATNLPTQAALSNGLAMITAAPKEAAQNQSSVSTFVSSGAVIEVSDLSIALAAGSGFMPIVRDLNFSLAAGDVVGIVGESGSGKTMTALAIAQLLPDSARQTGTIMFKGSSLRFMSSQELDRLLGTELAVVFQDPMTSLNPSMRIGRQITERAEIHQRLNHRSAVALAIRKLGEVHIPVPDRQMRRYPHELSGGMRQRVMIAMGLMTEPSLLIADEPTTALDVTIQAQIMDVLQEIHRAHGTTIILISHNLGLVSQNCDRILVMYAGRIVEDLTSVQLAAGAKHPYTNALLASVPRTNGPRAAQLVSIPGQAPDIGSPPAGCPFHPRCPFAVEKCHVVRPELLRRPDGSRVACHVANQDV